MGIFGLAKKFSNAFFDGLMKNMEDKFLKEAEKEGARSIAEDKKRAQERAEKLEEEELSKILDSIPEVGAGVKVTDEIIQLLTAFAESGGKTKAPIIKDFEDLNNNEGLNIRIRAFDENGRALITDYRNALLKAGTNKISTPKDVELIINNYVEPDEEEKLTAAKGEKSLKQVSYYIQQNFKNLSKYFLAAAEFSAINQTVNTSLLQRNLKIGFYSANEVLDQLESAGVISKTSDEGNYIVHLEGKKDIEAILLLLKDDIKSILIKYLEKNKE